MEKEIAIYLSKLHFENFKCFKGINEFDLIDKNGKIFQWTVILGNNNTGKTNLLKAVAGIEPHLLKIGNDKKSYVPLDLIRDRMDRKQTFQRTEKQSYVGCEFNYINRNTNKNYFSSQSKEFEIEKRYIKIKRPHWGYSPNIMWASSENSKLKDVKIYGYGVTRRSGDKGLSDNDTSLNASSLYEINKPLINIEDWLMQLDYSSKNKNKIALNHLKKIKKIIKSDIFPEISDFRLSTSNDMKNFMEFQTNAGWFKLEELGYGYQTTLSWIIDYCKKLFERYPTSINPLKEPGILLIDEIDLHLHPNWQRSIIRFLSNVFPATQFIVTTHSPLVIQSLDKVNLFVLCNIDNQIVIKKAPNVSYYGWTIEEILDEVMEMGDNIKSSEYKNLIKIFNNALDSNNFSRAKATFEKLSNILHPNSSERKLLKLQLSQIKK